MRPPAAQAKPTTQSSAGSSCRANSFVAGTRVLLADGTTVPIEQIELGDEVLAADPTTGEQGAYPVTALIEGAGVKTLVTIETEADTVITTGGHPFWSVTDRAWVDAVDLDAGNELLTAEGTTQTVTEVTVEQARTVVFNLTVELLHTYYVATGTTNVLVHNCGGAGPVRAGQHGELQAASYGIGPKTPFQGASGVNRIAGGTNRTAISEVKNVNYQSFTTRMKDYLTEAARKDLRFDLFVRADGGTRISGPLRDAIGNAGGRILGVIIL